MTGNAQSEGSERSKSRRTFVGSGNNNDNKKKFRTWWWGPKQGFLDVEETFGKMEYQDAPPIIPTIDANLTLHCVELGLFCTGDSFPNNYFGPFYHPCEFVDVFTLYVKMYVGCAFKH